LCEEVYHIFKCLFLGDWGAISGLGPIFDLVFEKLCAIMTHLLWTKVYSVHNIIY
jgi:hypothetical protein